MLTLKQVRDIFLIEDLEELYEKDRKILEVIEEDLELYLSEIDGHFESKEKADIYFNFGFLYSANCRLDHDTEKFYELVNQLKDEELLTEKSYDNFLAGFEKHQNEFFSKPDLNDKVDSAAYFIERALITKYCTDNINSLKSQKILYIFNFFKIYGKIYRWRRDKNPGQEKREF